MRWSSRRPTVKQAQQQVAVAEARLKDARREVVPDLQLRAGEQQNLEALPEAPGKKTGAQSFASVGIELPLWNRNQGNKQAAEAELEPGPAGDHAHPIISAATGRDPGTKLSFRQRRSGALSHRSAASRPSGL